MTAYQCRDTDIPQRLAYGKALAEYGAVNPNVVVLDADVSSSTFTFYFASRYPERFFNLGVTEDAMVNVGVGLALGGLVPFVNTFAALLTLRACEQIRTCVAYADTNVKLIGGYAGLSDYKDGPTHFAINDIAIMRSMPNLAVIAPADNVDAARLVSLIAEYPGPVYMRVSRAAVPDIFDETHTPEIGRGVTLRDGADLTLVGTGSMVARCLRAAEALERENIQARVISLSTIKPIDKALIVQAAEETGAIVTAEEHSVIGGLGSAVAEVLRASRPTPLRCVGLPDTFGETGLDPESLMDAWGLAVGDIVRAAGEALACLKA